MLRARFVDSHSSVALVLLFTCLHYYLRANALRYVLYCRTDDGTGNQETEGGGGLDSQLLLLE